MAKKKVKGIYCSNCQGLVEIYKKGKKKQYICENCGPIAHNPAPLIALGARAVGGFLARKAVSELTSSDSDKVVKAPQSRSLKSGLSLTDQVVLKEVYGGK